LLIFSAVQPRVFKMQLLHVLLLTMAATSIHLLLLVSIRAATVAMYPELYPASQSRGHAAPLSASSKRVTTMQGSRPSSLANPSLRTSAHARKERADELGTAAIARDALNELLANLDDGSAQSEGRVPVAVKLHKQHPKEVASDRTAAKHSTHASDEEFEDDTSISSQIVMSSLRQLVEDLSPARIASIPAARTATTTASIDPHGAVRGFGQAAPQSKRADRASAWGQVGKQAGQPVGQQVGQQVERQAAVPAGAPSGIINGASFKRHARGGLGMETNVGAAAGGGAAAGEASDFAGLLETARALKRSAEQLNVAIEAQLKQRSDTQGGEAQLASERELHAPADPLGSSADTSSASRPSGTTANRPEVNHRRSSHEQSTTKEPLTTSFAPQAQAQSKRKKQTGPAAATEAALADALSKAAAAASDAAANAAAKAAFGTGAGSTSGKGSTESHSEPLSQTTYTASSTRKGRRGASSASDWELEWELEDKAAKGSGLEGMLSEELQKLIDALGGTGADSKATLDATHDKRTARRKSRTRRGKKKSTKADGSYETAKADADDGDFSVIDVMDS